MSQRIINEIKRLYDQATVATVDRDLKHAIELLKTLPDEETRARAAVFMDGLAQMRSEWNLEKQRQQRKSGATGMQKKTRKRSSV
jgi:hypothetical protein